jgi:hypothetical protein
LEKEYAVYKKEDNDKYSLSSSTQALTPSTPRVGMTASEMSASTWGIPKDKNRTTTADGVSEQWVYSSNKYVYLDDGIVTAIQD